MSTRLLGIVLLAPLASAQAPYQTAIEPALVDREIPVNRGSTAVWQSLKKLRTRASLVMITAHPDDEDGGVLAFESRGRGTRVALVTLNRGEGGANVMSADYFDALGLVRTMELLEAGRYYGVEQYWTRVVDYGFSKTRAESVSRWTHDRVLGDVVRLVRTIRPLVISSVFVGGPSDGHGNHETAGAMAQEAFQAAGDPRMFPEQIAAGLRPWTPLKDYARVPRRGGLTANLTIPHGDYDPMLGASYTQIAREGLGFQKTQNGGPSIPPPGPSTSAYHRYASRLNVADTEQSFFDGIDVSLIGIATLAKGGDTAFLQNGLREIDARVEEAIAKFDARRPEAVAPALAAGLKATRRLLDMVANSSLADDAKFDVRHELQIKAAQFNNALAEALGLSIWAAANGEFGMAVPGQSIDIQLEAVNRSSAPVELQRLSLQQGQSFIGTGGRKLEPNQRFEARHAVVIPADASFTGPYFSRPDIEQSYYDIRDDKLFGRPLPPYPLVGWADFLYDGAPIRIGQYVQAMRRINGLGTVWEPLAIGPAIGVAISPRAGIVPLDARSFPVSVLVHSNVKGPAKGTARLDLPQGWAATPQTAEFATAADGQDQTITFTVTPAALAAKSYSIAAIAEYEGREYREGYDVTGYPGIRPYFLYRASTYRTTGVDVKVAPGLKIAYVMGTGDEVPASLEHLGIKAQLLSPADVSSGDLSRYDALVLGVRAYAARDDLRASNPRLLEYVKNGGVVLVQYNTPEFDHNYGPYPYVMGRDPEEVTDENSRVTILNPAHPLFAWPNRITEKDFEGWVEERGSKWLQTWDPKYEALLETHDEGQAPQKGGLLYARYGKGVWVYNAYAFYRQLPEGVPGAFRLFANLLSLPKNPALR